MTERCPGCGVPSQVCARPECEVARLRAQAQRDQETIRLARKCIEAADEMRGWTTTAPQRIWDSYDAARAEWAKVLRSASDPEDDTCPCGQRYGEYGHDH